MDLKNTFYAISKGGYDSLRGMITIFYLDREINDRLRHSPSRQNVLIRQKSASKENTPVRQLKKDEESKVLKRIIQCGVLNGGIFLASILLFEYGLLPVINFCLCYIFGSESFISKFVWSWIKPVLSFVFKSIWVVPLFLLSKIVNALWFQDIADAAYKHTRGRPKFPKSISVSIADSIFSVVIQTLFLMQSLATCYIPIIMVGYILSNIQMCMLYALYAFEYKWYNMGWELHKRLDHIETNWPYFIGFGLPLTIFTQLSDSWIINGCVFSILFPFFIISGNAAEPMLHANGLPLHFFSPVITLSNALFSRTIGSKTT